MLLEDKKGKRFIMEKLKRENLIKINDKHVEIKKENISTEEYINYFNIIENEINNHLFEFDDRFTTYGRRDFLQQEFNNFLNNNNYINALINLQEYMCCYTSFLTPADILQEETRKFHDVLKDNDDYLKDGIICLQEKNIIIDMINEFRKSI